MRPKSLILLALALGCGLVASIGISQVMSHQDAAPQTAADMEPVLVALRDIERTEPLTPENVALRNFPKESIPEGAVREFTEVENLRPSTRLIAGEIILNGKIGSSEKATKSIPAGYRAVTVKVDATTGGAGLLVPGDRVDVQVFARKNPSAGVMESGTWTFLQDVTVFAVNSAITTDPDNPNQTMEAKTITLLVTPQQAAKVSLAAEVGRIRLIVRGASDSTETANSGATWDDVVRTSDKLDGDEGEKPKPSNPLADSQPADGGISHEMIAAFNAQQAAQQAHAATQMAAVEAPPFEMVIHDGANIRVMQFRDGDKTPLDVTRATGGQNLAIPQANPNSSRNPNSAGHLPAVTDPDFVSVDDWDASTADSGYSDSDANSADDDGSDEPMYDDGLVD